MGDSAESKANHGGPQSKRTSAAGDYEPDKTDDLIRAINHKLRRQILRYLHSSRKPLSPKQIERKLDLSALRSGVLSSVSYHVGVLRDFKAITMVKTEPRRGAVEHFYESAVSNSVWVRNLLKKTQKRDEALIWTRRRASSNKSADKKESRDNG